MTQAKSFDAVVIGAGLNGLCAAAYLARLGRTVVVLEKQNEIGGACRTIKLTDKFEVSGATYAWDALDPAMLKDLQLARFGLRFSIRDLPLIVLRADCRNIVLSRDLHETMRSIAAHSDADAWAWPRFLKDVYAMARQARPLWWDQARPVKSATRRMLEDLSLTSAAAFLDRWFENDALKAALAFDARNCARAPTETGSALALIWRYSQEMSGRQAAVAVAEGGPGALIKALAASVREAGGEIRTGARVASVICQQDETVGVSLASGEIVPCRLVMSSLPARDTFSSLLPRGIMGLGEAHAMASSSDAPATLVVHFALDHLPVLRNQQRVSAARYVIAERVDALVAAHAFARNGRIAEELSFAFEVPSLFDDALAPPGQHIFSVRIHPFPSDATADEKVQAEILSKLGSVLEQYLPGFSRHIIATRIQWPRDMAEQDGTAASVASVERLMASWSARTCTSLHGLMLCGISSEPVDCLSGRAGRMAATIGGGTSSP